MTDRLGVRSSTAVVVASSQHVRIDDGAIERLAQDLTSQESKPEWDSDLHYRATGTNADERTAMWILVLDTLNFCFWGQGLQSQHRWRVRWRGELVDGYVGLVAALTNAVQMDYPLHDPNWLADISRSDVISILAPEEGHTEIPLLEHRIQNLRELGRFLSGYGDLPATSIIQQAEQSATKLVQNIVRQLPSFNDVATWPHADTGLPHNEVRFYKRAQILVGDLSGALSDSPLGLFRDLDQLTAFADYKIPQILRELGVLVYDQYLAQIVDTRQRITAGSRMEIEIRAATIIACDRIALNLQERGRFVTAAELDWLLWSRSQHLPVGSRSYHLTETIFY